VPLIQPPRRPPRRTGQNPPSTNKPYRIHGVSIGRLESEGKIKTNRDYWNMADYLMQVGILPPPS
jgi:hypothetical protein